VSPELIYVFDFSAFSTEFESELWPAPLPAAMNGVAQGTA